MLSVFLIALKAPKVFSNGFKPLPIADKVLLEEAIFQNCLADCRLSKLFKVPFTALYPLIVFCTKDSLGILVAILAVVAIKLAPPVGAASKAPPISSSIASPMIPAV